MMLPEGGDNLADELKATRIEIQREKGAGGNPHKGICYYTDTTTVPPTPGNVSTNMSDATIGDPLLMRAAFDTALAFLTSKTIDWDI